MSTSIRITVEQFDAMIAEGRFDVEDGTRVELIEGEILTMCSIGDRHADVVDELNQWSILNAPLDRVRIRSQNPVGLPELESVLAPDLTWLRLRNYRHSRPTTEDVLLVVEVSDSSLSFDRGRKARLYATAGLADYWIVNLPGDCIEVRRDPDGGGYRSIETFRAGDVIAPLAFPGVALPVATLFPPEID